MADQLFRQQSEVGGTGHHTKYGVSSTATPAATPPSACSMAFVRRRWPAAVFITISLPCLQRKGQLSTCRAESLRHFTLGNLIHILWHSAGQVTVT